MKKILFLLDGSGSMTMRVAQTIDGVNTYANTFKERDDILFELVVWDSARYQTLYNGLIKNFPGISVEDYRCESLTPLVDVFGKGIKSLDFNSSFEKSVLVVMTDGKENDSKEYTFDTVKKMLSEFRERGNEVIFMGAGLDSWDSVKLAKSLGTQSQFTQSYDFGTEVSTYTHTSKMTRKALGEDDV